MPLFRLLLRLYPRTHRVRYGAEMEAFFLEERRRGARGARFWVGLVADHVGAAWRMRTRGRGGRMGMGRWLDDLRSAVRSVARTPAFSLFVVGTLALGIGATAAAFTVVDRILLRPLPYPGSERMALVGISPRHDPGSLGPLSPALLLELRADPGPVEELVGAATSAWILEQTGADTERIRSSLLTEGFLSFFGARPAVGRLFLPDDHAEGAPRVVLLDHAAWVARFGADPGVVGTTLRLNGEPHTVVGVLSRDFVAPPEVMGDGGFLLPFHLDAEEVGSFYLAGVARMRPGMGLEALQAQADQAVEAVYGGEGPRFVVGGSVRDYRSTVVGPVGGSLYRVLGAMGLLLLIACVNVTGLLLTRGTARRHELDVRSALGASRGRLVRKLVLENVLLALAGGAGGSLLAWGAVELFRRAAPSGLPRLAEVAVDARALVFALLLSGIAVVVSGLLPAFRATRRTGSGGPQRPGTASQGEGRLRGSLVVAETALAVTLAVGSALLAHDLVRIAREDPGFRPDGVVAMQVDLAPRYSREEWAPIWERLLEGARALPGVEAAAVSTQAPFDGSRLADSFRPGEPGEGAAGEDEPVMVISVGVGGDLVEALGTRVVEGRTFAPGDGSGPPVALVNRAFVEEYWPGESAVGKVLRSGGNDEAAYTILGVLEDIRTGPGQAVPPQVYLPLRTSPWRAMEILVRAGEESGSLAPALREVVRRVDPALPVIGIRSMAALEARALADSRFYALLFGGFAGVALLLAVVGVYATTAFATRTRLREVGIRLALGARRPRVVGALVARAGGAVALGVATGLAGAAGLSRFLTDSLVHVGARDGLTYLTVGLLVLAAGVLAAWIPATAAGRADPVSVLREE